MESTITGVGIGIFLLVAIPILFFGIVRAILIWAMKQTNDAVAAALAKERSEKFMRDVAAAKKEREAAAAKARAEIEAKAAKDTAGDAVDTANRLIKD